MTDVIVKRFEKPDVVRTFERGKFEIISIGGMTIGGATYEPGWRWSEHVGKAQGLSECKLEHVGMVVAGRAMAAMSNGVNIEMKAGGVLLHRPRARFLGHRRFLAAFPAC